MLREIKTLDEVKQCISEHSICIIAFSTLTCNVCIPLKTKVGQVIASYEKVGYGNVFIEEVQEAQGAYEVYTSPIFCLFVEEKEVKRYSAAIDLHELEQTIHRYYDLLELG